MSKQTLALLAAVLLLTTGPLLLHQPRDESELFTGADGQAQEAISQLHPTYKPWARPLFKPPSGEIESLLFALQAALGAGVLGYYFGRRQGRVPQAAGV